MLQQGAAGLRGRHASPAADQECDPERLLHVTDPRGGGCEREIRALRAVRDTAGFDDVPEQTEVRQIESHDAAFAKDEVRLIIMAIAYAYINDNVSYNAKFGPPLICGSSMVSIAADSRIG